MDDPLEMSYDSHAPHTSGDARRSVVMVSPHLDDAVLSAWHVLTESSDALVVTCFSAGDLSGPSGERLVEDDRALHLVGARRARLDVGRPSDGTRRDRRVARSALAELLAPYLVDTAEVWFPMGIGGHSHHRIAHRATRRALHSLAIERRPTAYVYADLPYGAALGWPPWLDATTSEHSLDLPVAALRSVLRATRPGTDRLWLSAVCRVLGPMGPMWLFSARVAELSPDEQRAKRDAVLEYRSQAQLLGYLDEDATRLLRAEVTWAWPPWRRRGRRPFYRLPGQMRSRTPHRLRSSRWAVLHARRPEAQHTEREARRLAYHARGSRTVVELGVGEGASALSIATALGVGAHLYCIDPYEVRGRWPSAARAVARRMVRARARCEVHWLRTSSQQAAEAWAQEIDLLLIDGRHTTADAQADWVAWVGHLRMGGRVIFRRLDGQMESWVAHQPGWSVVESLDDHAVAARDEGIV
jgi:LmbE family N-acetylglucosaminyl deacetylase